jgi:heptaprenyl diphosphate synthase
VNVFDIYAALAPELDAIEQDLRKRLSSPSGVLEQASLHLLVSGGKRLRPVFVLLAGSFGKTDSADLVRVASALELIHMASLVHDDVVDDAMTRRGQATVRSEHGNRVAMYTGDFIFARALSCLSEFPDPTLHRVFSRAIEHICLGEIQQIGDLWSTRQSVSRYLRRIRRKTALLFEMACALGAISAKVEPVQSAALRRYGYSTGMAFQIVDDILDITADETVLGKPVGGDLRQGNLTAPVLYAVQDARVGNELARMIRPVLDQEDVRKALRLVGKTDGVERAQQLAERYLARAMQALGRLPCTKEREWLKTIAAFVFERDR